MGQCTATITHDNRERAGLPCTREPVIGSKPPLCFKHGGEDVTETPEKMRKRADRPRLRCSADNKTGRPCKNYALHGASVCVTHGGNMPNVKRSAAVRMLELQTQSLGILDDLMADAAAGNLDPAMRLKLATAVLDRSGLGTSNTTTVEVTVKPWERLLRDVAYSRDVGVEGRRQPQPQIETRPVIEAEIIADEHPSPTTTDDPDGPLEEEPERDNVVVAFPQRPGGAGWVG